MRSLYRPSMRQRGHIELPEGRFQKSPDIPLPEKLALGSRFSEISDQWKVSLYMIMFQENNAIFGKGTK